MQTKGPLVIIEDDVDDQDIIRLSLKTIGLQQETIFFDDARKALEYLSNDAVLPFIIFSDINMPGMNGFELRDIIHADPDLRMRCVPYIFLTTGGDSKFIWQAYSKSAQGYFVKPNTMTGWTELLGDVISYWKRSKKPARQEG